MRRELAAPVVTIEIPLAMAHRLKARMKLMWQAEKPAKFGVQKDIEELDRLIRAVSLEEELAEIASDSGTQNEGYHN